MAELSRECERIARGWLVETQGNPETGALRHAIRLLLEEAEAEVERLRTRSESLEALVRPARKLLQFARCWNVADLPTSWRGAVQSLADAVEAIDKDQESKLDAARQAFESAAEAERLQEELQGANECLAMICSRLDSFGVPMEATPPMNYDDAISGLLFRRLKEAGVFPGHPATVRYEVHDREGDDDWFRRVPLEAAEAEEGE